MNKECCGAKLETPYCPICGKKNVITGPEHRLLKRTMAQYSVEKKKIERFSKYDKEDNIPKVLQWLAKSKTKFAELIEELEWLRKHID